MMDETRDTELGRRLEVFGEPDHGPEYWRDVRRQVAESAAAVRRPAFGGRLRAAFSRRSLRLSLAAVAVAAVTATALLAGLPRTHGPETVSAVEVLDKVLAVNASLRTWQADFHLKWYDGRVWRTYHAYATRRARLVWAADGSARETWFPVMAAGHRLPGGAATTEVYDATTGDGGAYYDPETRTWSRETDVPLGPPDAGTVPGVDMGTTVRALAASRTLRLSEAVVDGRPAWTVSCTQGEMAGLPPSGEDWPVYTVLVDKQTSLLLGVRVVTSGRITLSARWRNVRVNEPLPDDVFTKQAPAAVTVKRIDDGFRRLSLDDAAASPGVTPLVPRVVPGGYRLAQVAVAARAVMTRELDGVEGSFGGRHVFVLQYRRGFDALTVTTRATDDSFKGVDIDPVEEFDQAWSRRARTEAPITLGAFNGATARILVGSTTSVPHLWALKDGVLLTIAGAASAGELLAMAESLQVFPGPSPAAE